MNAVINTKFECSASLKGNAQKEKQVVFLL